jgi:arabinogalactan endo-1,4-beta-galactosidase
MASEVTRDNKQITFELDKRSVLYWRRALLLRYFVQLGNETNFSIEWIDSDKAHKYVKSSWSISEAGLSPFKH